MPTTCATAFAAHHAQGSTFRPRDPTLRRPTMVHGDTTLRRRTMVHRSTTVRRDDMVRATTTTIRSTPIRRSSTAGTHGRGCGQPLFALVEVVPTFFLSWFSSTGS